MNEDQQGRQDQEDPRIHGITRCSGTAKTPYPMSLYQRLGQTSRPQTSLQPELEASPQSSK